MKHYFMMVGVGGLILLSGIGFHLYYKHHQSGQYALSVADSPLASAILKENPSLQNLRKWIKANPKDPRLIPIDMFFKKSLMVDSQDFRQNKLAYFQWPGPIPLPKKGINSFFEEGTKPNNRRTASGDSDPAYIPLPDFFKNSQVASVQLSPDGRYLAYLKPFQNRMNIYIRKVNNIGSEKRITNQTTQDIPAFTWKESHTLLFTKDFGGDENFHIFRVYLEGKGEQNLTPFPGTKVHIIDPLTQISEDHILIAMNKRDKRLFDVYRLNIKTGKTQLVLENPGYFTNYVTDHKGQLRIAVGGDGLNSYIFYRETEAEPFNPITITSFKDMFLPVAFTFDNKNLYVMSNLNRDKQAIEIFDPKQKQVLSEVFSHPEVNVANLFYSRKRKVLTGVSYITWKRQFHFLDPLTEQIYADLKSHFPPRYEVTTVSLNKEEDLWVVAVTNDRNPGSYYLYDVQKQSVQKIADTRPWLEEEKLAETKPIQYKTRDGLTIHGYLTLPPQMSQETKLPVIVHPHGGPWQRDSWGYNPEVQFLASRGYAVFQMNFRGSTGYGKNFWTAGFKEWGRKMQDDITDGVHYLIDKGIADPKKIAIYGASYGGYAVLVGLAFTSDLYACGVDYVGISNIFTFLESIPPYWEPMRKMMYEMIGHPETDRELLESISPLFHVDKIKVPLLVAQGAKDPRVKKAESDQIVQALEERGVEVPYLVKEDEGHGFQKEANRMEFYSLMEAFLAKCLQ